MKRSFFHFTRAVAVTALLLFSATVAIADELKHRRAVDQRVATDAPVQAAIPWTALGAQAGAQYQGDGLSIRATEDGARLWCVFQKLEGHATTEGLWLASSDTCSIRREPDLIFRMIRLTPDATNQDGHDRFRVMARAFGRANLVRELPAKGSVSVQPALARFTRPGVIEEYSVSADGVRQDFVIAQPPPGDGQLLLELEVTGAQAEQTPQGARLVLPAGRRIAYSRLHVTDAIGRKLPARIEVGSASLLRVFVDDAQAAYPIRVDPTFSDENWMSMGTVPGVNGTISDMAVLATGDVIIAGTFSEAGGLPASRVAKWNGNQWSPLGSGVNDYVWALAVIGQEVFAGGQFTIAGGMPANRIARWNGIAWSPFGEGLDDSVFELANWNGNLVAGGRFTLSGGTPVMRIARWDGVSWISLGVGVDSDVYAITPFGSELFVGGDFTAAGGIPVNRIAKWNGASWSALGSGVEGQVYSLISGGGSLYVGGNFTIAGGEPANRVARWNGSGWFPLGEGVLGPPGEMLFVEPDLFVAWQSRVDKWNGSSWSIFDSRSGTSAMSRHGEHLYLAGDFRTIPHIDIDDVVKWDGAAFSKLNVGVDGNVWSLVSQSTNFYAGGDFREAGGRSASRIAHWNGQRWASLGAGFSNSVLALAASGTSLYAGGSFTNSGLVSLNRIARWDGNQWMGLGSGVNRAVHALLPSGDDLYVGGDFTTAGGSSILRIARWNGTTWNALGPGLSGGAGFPSNPVRALAFVGSQLYAGGDFAQAGGLPVSRIASWDGNAWSSLGSGVSGSFSRVTALAAMGTDLFVGGEFTSAGGVPVSNIARWSENQWHALGSGVTGRSGLGLIYSVSALCVVGTNLYVAGDFGLADGQTANRFARWDGHQWQVFGSGADNWIAAATSYESSVVIGGAFLQVGGKPSPYLSRLIPASAEEPVLGLEKSLATTELFVNWPASSVPFQLESAPAVGNAPGEWEPVSTPPVVENGTNHVTVPNAGSQFFRLRYP
jgi:hypothetical protein